MRTISKYWFPAKRFGWGWGPPVTWQGWVVLAVFTSLILAGALVIRPHVRTVFYLAYMALMCAALIAVCWLKGEPPRWRWGQKGRD